MKNLLLLAQLFFWSAVSVFGSQKRYDGSTCFRYEVLRLTPRNQRQLDLLHRLEDDDNTELDLERFCRPLLQLDFWLPPSQVNAQVDVMVSPASLKRLRKLLGENDIVVDVKVADVEKLIEKERDSNREPELQKGVAYQPSFRTDRYNRFFQISSHLRELEIRYPQLISVTEVGYSHERRPILLATIGGSTAGRRPEAGAKPAIYIDGAIHAREWISPAVVVYIIDMLVTHYDKDPEIRDLVDRVDWLIIPVLNPDGYEYSHTNDRMWRKNRRGCDHDRRVGGVFSVVGGRCCKGVDLNRNFDWSFASTGSSSNPCRDTFHGRGAFSEPESRTVRDLILGRQRQIKAFLSFHSYSQMWLLPFGDKRRSYPADYHSKLLPLAKKAVSALEKLYGTDYKIGTGADLMYSAAGGSEDWAKGKAKIEFTYLVELRPQGTFWSNGFVLPERDILPTSRETLAAVKVVAREVADKYSKPRRRPITVKPVTSRRPSRACKDTSRFCKWWQLFRSCDSPTVSKRCQKTCGFC